MGLNKIGTWALVVLLFTGCKVTEKKAKEYAYNHKDKLAEWCADCFPVKESEVLKGDTIVLIDTVSEIISDTVRVQADCPDGSVVMVDCPPNKTITKVVRTHSTDTIKVRDTAYERVLKDERDEYKDKWANMEQSRDTWRKRAIWGWGILFALGIGFGVRWYIRNRTISRIGW